MLTVTPAPTAGINISHSGPSLSFCFAQKLVFVVFLHEFSALDRDVKSLNLEWHLCFAHSALGCLCVTKMA